MKVPALSPPGRNGFAATPSRRLPRRADQQRGAGHLPLLRLRPLAALAPAAQSEGQADMGADGEAGRRLAPNAPDPSPLAERSLCRQTLEVGAVFGNSARTDLCGGR